MAVAVACILACRAVLTPNLHRLTVVVACPDAPYRRHSKSPSRTKRHTASRCCASPRKRNKSTRATRSPMNRSNKRCKCSWPIGSSASASPRNELELTRRAAPGQTATTTTKQTTIPTRVSLYLSSSWLAIIYLSIYQSINLSIDRSISRSVDRSTKSVVL